VKSPANETFSRWVYQGIPLIIGVGIVAAFVLRISFGLTTSKLAVPIAVLLGIQVVFYVGMYAVRKRYRRTRDLRIAAFAMGVYGLCIVLAGMYYAGQLGIASARTFEDNYVEFSVFMGVVTCIVVVIFSFVKPKPNS
jgi:UDP-N-acetylmuramyl pentapeptide phosphotransferase/UDP-N-acetylglucosamine-1-phosphate transferase